MYPVIVCSRKDTSSFTVTNLASSDGKGSLPSGGRYCRYVTTQLETLNTRAGLLLRPWPGNRLAAETSGFRVVEPYTRW